MASPTRIRPLILQDPGTPNPGMASNHDTTDLKNAKRQLREIFEDSLNEAREMMPEEPVTANVWKLQTLVQLFTVMKHCNENVLPHTGAHWTSEYPRQSNIYQYNGRRRIAKLHAYEMVRRKMGDYAT
ncbi:hypothetical protein CSUB01_02724 [Colletotrichum sublineola]|uniref:Uncharacterized protein n=1 Tax=Colletotrichum sublineola TaxID=1173701 RepID=A0A066XEG8_COLSU|nr:hypothetical protein CSUB01_02724 [Colletotrichum sublineola]